MPLTGVASHHFAPLSSMAILDKDKVFKIDWKRVGITSSFGYAFDGSAQNYWSMTGERTVKWLRLCKALTILDHTTVYEACQRMAARRVKTLLLTNFRSRYSCDEDLLEQELKREARTVFM